MTILETFKRKHADARRPLDRWVEVTQEAQWTNFADLRGTFGNADLVKTGGTDYTVFNIAGNRYRLVTEIDYQGIMVVVDCVLSHADYSKERWKKTN